MMKQSIPAYRAIVKLAGDASQEAIKIGITAAEVALLKLIHGQEDGLRDIVRTGTNEIDLEELRTNLVRKYGRQQVDAAFGPAGNSSLPITVNGNSTVRASGSETNEIEALRFQIAELTKLATSLTKPPAEEEDASEFEQADGDDEVFVAPVVIEEDIAAELEAEEAKPKFVRHKKGG